MKPTRAAIRQLKGLEALEQRMEQVEAQLALIIQMLSEKGEGADNSAPDSADAIPPLVDELKPTKRKVR